MSNSRRNVRSLTLEELTEWAESHGHSSYRGSQLAGWLYNRPLTAVRNMHNLPAALRESLEQDFDCSFPTVARRSAKPGPDSALIGSRAPWRLVLRAAAPFRGSGSG